VFETPSADLKTPSAAIEMLRAPKRLLELEFLIAARPGEFLKLRKAHELESPRNPLTPEHDWVFDLYTDRDDIKPIYVTKKSAFQFDAACLMLFLMIRNSSLTILNINLRIQ